MGETTIHTRALKILVFFLALSGLFFFLFHNCGRVESDLATDEGGAEGSYSVAILEDLPSETQSFFRIILGQGTNKNPCRDSVKSSLADKQYLVNENVDCVSDYYMNEILAKKLPAEFPVTQKVELSYDTTSGGERPFRVTVKHRWRGIKINNKMIALREKSFDSGGGNFAESGIWWLPLFSCPTTVLGDQSLEDKLRFCLDTLVYEKIRLKQSFQTVDTLESVISFVPVLGSYNDLVYNQGGVRAGAWLVGDLASFGFASKVQAISKTAYIAYAATLPIRIGVSATNLTTGKGSVVDVADSILATLEGSFAVLRFVKMRRILKGGALITVPADTASATTVANHLGTSVDELAEGLTSENLLRLGLPDANAAKGVARSADEYIARAADQLLEFNYSTHPRKEISVQNFETDMLNIFGGDCLLHDAANSRVLIDKSAIPAKYHVYVDEAVGALKRGDPIGIGVARIFFDEAAPLATSMRKLMSSIGDVQKKFVGYLVPKGRSESLISKVAKGATTPGIPDYTRRDAYRYLYRSDDAKTRVAYTLLDGDQIVRREILQVATNRDGRNYLRAFAEDFVDGKWVLPAGERNAVCFGCHTLEDSLTSSLLKPTQASTVEAEFQRLGSHQQLPAAH